MCGFAYAASVIVYQIGGLFTGEASFGFLTAVAVALLGVFAYLLTRKGHSAKALTRV